MGWATLKKGEPLIIHHASMWHELNTNSTCFTGQWIKRVQYIAEQSEQRAHLLRTFFISMDVSGNEILNAYCFKPLTEMAGIDAVGR